MPSFTCRTCNQSFATQQELNAHLVKHVELLTTENLKPNDPVNHPKHYTKHPSGVECIEITEHMNFNLGNAVKYIWRAGDKGRPLEDLSKAVWYLNREIERLSKIS